uniref:Methyltransferase-like 26 n=1 Tax=Steinernema glaseri TaxID=37863 RepID=A0A1I8AJF2_9BILA
MLVASAAERNKDPILDVLKQHVDQSPGKKILEIASGTGQHALHIAQHYPNAIIQPSERNPRSLHSIVAYVDKYRLPNIRVPLFIDITKPPDFWNLTSDFAPSDVDVVLNINMIHISSNDAVDGLFSAAGLILKRGTGLLITYGPYKVDGVCRPQSNVDFDASLREQNPEWGLRDIAELKEKALYHRMELIKIHEMPANNHMLIFRRM